jgi:glucan 1,4-alpha-glucosidase
MNKLTATTLWMLVGSLAIWSCAPTPNLPDQGAASVVSPDGKLRVEVFLTDEGQPAYLVQRGDQTVIDTSTLGFELLDQAPLRTGFAIKSVQRRLIDETWEMPWGEQRKVRNQARELRLSLEETTDSARRMDLVFRAYDDGIAFRYDFPEQPNLDLMVILAEETQFQLTGDHSCWWIPGDWDIYEHLYNQTPLSQIDAISKRDHPNLAQTYIPYNAVNTPVTMKTQEGLYLSFHEAALYDYSGMTLRVDTASYLLTSELVGGPENIKVTRKAPFATPWRTVQIADRAGDLIESKLIVNLNQPSVLEDVSWFTPMKYVGIWWEMHLGKATWKLEGGEHGATTENAKRYIDFCAANGIDGLLVEGWNTGWERWIGFEDREGVFDFVTSYEDYDIEEVVRYGQERGVQLIMHHETSAAPRTYDEQLEEAYQLCEDLGIHSVKTGYVGKIIPKGQYHHGQWMINHYQRVVEMAAKHKVAVNAHEPIKATGKRRTWPNIISREGLRGQEFNAWSSDGGNPPEHLPTVAFTRMLAGPIDYTPGIFNLKLKPYQDENQVNTTLAQQLALYVVIYSPIQMAADLPEHYEGEPAFQFIRDVAVDWEQSRVIDGEPGDFVTIARQERGSDRWFLGSITDENARTVKIPLDFLAQGKSYRTDIYRDGEDAHWDDNPTSIVIESRSLTAKDTLTLNLAPGGGVAVSFDPE